MDLRARRWGAAKFWFREVNTASKSPTHSPSSSSFHKKETPISNGMYYQTSLELKCVIPLNSGFREVNTASEKSPTHSHSSSCPSPKNRRPLTGCIDYQTLHGQIPSGAPLLALSLPRSAKPAQKKIKARLIIMPCVTNSARKFIVHSPRVWIAIEFPASK